MYLRSKYGKAGSAGPARAGIVVLRPSEPQSSMPLLHQYTFPYSTTAKTGKPQALPCHIPTHIRVFTRFLAGVSQITPISDHFRYTPTSFRQISCMCVPEVGRLQPQTTPSHDFSPDFLHVCRSRISPTSRLLQFLSWHNRFRFPRQLSTIFGHGPE